MKETKVEELVYAPNNIFYLFIWNLKIDVVIKKN